MGCLNTPNADPLGVPKICITCGKSVRLRAMKCTISRKRGVMHWLEHVDGSPLHEVGWDAVMLKPYPARDRDKPWWKMVQKWKEANTQGAAAV